MILFLDSDSICKRYLEDEDHVEATQSLMDAAEVLAASTISYVEVRGVLARARRARRITSARAYTSTTAQFESDWDDFFRIDISDEIVLDAGRLAEKHYLRAMDAVILATALKFQARAPEPISISTWDKNSGLIAAIHAEGLSVAHEVNS